MDEVGECVHNTRERFTRKQIWNATCTHTPASALLHRLTAKNHKPETLQPNPTQKNIMIKYKLNISTYIEFMLCDPNKILMCFVWYACSIYACWNWIRALHFWAKCCTIKIFDTISNTISNTSLCSNHKFDPIKCDHLKHIISIKRNSTAHARKVRAHKHIHTRVVAHTRRSFCHHQFESRARAPPRWPIVCNNEPRMYVSFAAANKFDIGARSPALLLLIA